MSWFLVLLRILDCHCRHDARNGSKKLFGERLVGIPYTVLTWSQLWGLSATCFLTRWWTLCLFPILKWCTSHHLLFLFHHGWNAVSYVYRFYQRHLKVVHWFLHLFAIPLTQRGAVTMKILTVPWYRTHSNGSKKELGLNLNAYLWVGIGFEPEP